MQHLRLFVQINDVEIQENNFIDDILMSQNIGTSSANITSSDYRYFTHSGLEFARKGRISMLEDGLNLIWIYILGRFK